MSFKDKVVYQIYPKSFYDSNGDGLGDIKGITQKLDYLAQLGVDYIWSTPFFVSPQNDNGYDVADYCKIDERFGTMADVEELISEAGKRGISLMFDMVFNHTSTEHEWFKKALSGDAYYKDFYIFKDGKGDEPPTNWISKFGGNAWQYAPEVGQYYLHLFDKTQADLNWENPNVRAELANVVKFWVAKGVKGFRFDVVNLISKPDVYEDDFEGDGRRFYTDGKNVDEYLYELCKVSGITRDQLLTVGEMSSTSLANCVNYSKAENEELSMCFNFHHLKVDYKDNKKWELAPFDFAQLKSLYNEWQLGMQAHNGWNALFWNNHDQPRAVSRFCDDQALRIESAKMLGGCIHLMQGTPYIYQGEEIGMTNAGFTEISQYRDVESLNYFEILQKEGKTTEQAYQLLNERSRDNSRTPMQWNSEDNAGFTTGTPWLSVNTNFPQINAESELQDPNSVFHFYKALIKLRKQYSVIASGQFKPLLENHDRVFGYERFDEQSSILVFCNFFAKTVTLNMAAINIDDYQFLMGNYQDKALQETLVLEPYEFISFCKRCSEG